MAEPRRTGQKRGNRHIFQGRDPITGRRMNVRAGSLAELESRIARVHRVRDGLKYGDLSVVEAQGELRPAIGQQNRVRDLWARYSSGLSLESLGVASTTWKSLLERHFGDALVWDLTETRMRAWHADMARVRRPGGKRGYAPKYIRQAWDFLRAAVALAERDGVISGAPWGDFTVPDPKRPQNEREACRSNDEFFALIAAAKSWDEAHGLVTGRAVIILTLLLCGLRQAEAAGLAWDDLDIDRVPPMLHVRRQARRRWPETYGGTRPSQAPKGGHARSQQLHPDVASVLRFHRDALRREGRYRPEGPVFPSKGGGAWRTDGMVITPKAFREIVQRAGLPNVARWVVHSTKHSFATLELIGHGGDLRTVAEHRTGHRSLEQLEGYVKRGARDAGGSKIPELPPALSPIPVLIEGASAPRLLPPSPLTVPRDERAIVTEDNFPALAREWLAGHHSNGRKRPPKVTLVAKANAARAYGAEFYKSHDREKARAAGKRARVATLGAWARALRLAEANRLA